METPMHLLTCNNMECRDLMDRKYFPEYTGEEAVRAA
jgi:hypothetical protein